jgi:hypothetical protein
VSEGDPARGFPPHVLREYALIADGERGALIGPRGEVAWLCAPRWESDAIFAALLGGAGIYAVTPAGRFVWGGHYEPRSLIWRSRWVTEDGIVECREALARPADAGRVVLLRRLRAGDGGARVRIVLAPRAGFGREPLEAVRCEDGVWEARTGRLGVRWAGAGGARVVGTPPAAHLALELELPPGAEHDLTLEIADGALAGPPPDPAAAWGATERAWADSVPALSGLAAPRDARHAVAVLRGLTSADGAMVAAATTSLPERAEAGRNYDYRYAWIRDQCFAGQAGAAAGALDLLDDAVRFVGQRLRADGPALRPAYTTAGAPLPEERHVGLPGYPGGSDVVGNRAGDQLQIDAFGEALLLLATAGAHGRLDADGRAAMRAAARALSARWTEPDAGIWEIEPRHWTHSRLIAAGGLRAAAPFVPSGEGDAWRRLADRIVGAAEATSVHPTGRWQRAPDDARVDAALLLPLLRGTPPLTDPRGTATLDAVVDELTDDGYAYRFRQGDEPLGQAEGAFVFCGFLLALAFDRLGDPARARHWFERNRAACGPPGLLAEEYDVTQRQLRGNLPQAFVHALLLECAARLGA